MTGRLERGACCERITTCAWEIDACPRGRLGPSVRAISTCHLPPDQVRPARRCSEQYGAAGRVVVVVAGLRSSFHVHTEAQMQQCGAVLCVNGTGGGSIDARTYLGRHRLIITGMGSCRRRRRRLFLRRLPPEICFTEGGLK